MSHTRKIWSGVRESNPALQFGRLPPKALGQPRMDPGQRLELYARMFKQSGPEGILEIPTLIYRTRAFPLKLLRQLKMVADLGVEPSASEVMSLECTRYTCPQ